MSGGVETKEGHDSFSLSWFISLEIGFAEQEVGLGISSACRFVVFPAHSIFVCSSCTRADHEVCHHACHRNRSDGPQPNMTIVINGHDIESVVPSDHLQLPTATKLIPGNGMFVIPGLWDMHVRCVFCDFGMLAGGSDTSNIDPYGENFCFSPSDNLVCSAFEWQDGVMSALPGLGGNNSYASNSNRSGHIAIVDGGAIGTVVTISSASAQVTLSKIKIYNGFSHTAAGMPGGGGINNMGVLTINHSSISNNGTVPWGPGGGIYNSGALTINTSTISGNKAHVGGGISNNGILRISNSTISQNVAKAFCIRLIHYSCEFAYGGGISTSGTVTITNSTISANWVSGGDGGGISSGTGATINNSTISQNGATCLSIQNHCYAGSGGDISSAGSTTVQNSIVANSPSGGQLQPNYDL